MTITTLAKKASVPKSTLHGWITGRRTMDLTQLSRVSQALEVPLYELVFGTNDPFSQNGDLKLEEIFTGNVRVSIQKIN